MIETQLAGKFQSVSYSHAHGNCYQEYGNNFQDQHNSLLVLDARWGKSRTKGWVFGYKLHISCSTGRLIVPPNITLIPFPAKCPKLNPQENIWQFLRDNWLSNRIFKSFDDIVDHCCEAWNKLVDQPWRIMSIGMRDWAYGS